MFIQMLSAELQGWVQMKTVVHVFLTQVKCPLVGAWLLRWKFWWLLKWFRQNVHILLFRDQFLCLSNSPFFHISTHSSSGTTFPPIHPSICIHHNPSTYLLVLPPVHFLALSCITIFIPSVFLSISHFLIHFHPYIHSSIFPPIVLLILH